MVFSEFKKLLQYMMPGRWEVNMPPDDVIRSLTHRALKRVARETLPLRLVVDDPSQLTVIRKIDDNTYIRTPLRPFRDDDDIDIDEDLVEAVAAHVASELEPQRKGHFLQMYEREIAQNNDRLIETDLDYFNRTNTRRDMSWL